ncbi:GerMN domain-containing protein [Blastococcus sp. TBT05-19]|uniref:GerMN domain-containing protein n=1 Tax=Blastococcus sp. TBT05-19 TaxID=2250581 RepID=UPI0013148622|nr:GerMN domain-containing protein [Blastococcus sp. TBT05-19]
MARTLVPLVAAGLVTGCGVAPQDAPEPVSTAAAPAVETGNGGPPSGPRVQVFFVRGADLAPVARRTTAPDPVDALDLLVEGPTRTEAADGIRTALAPEVVGVDEVLPDGTATVSLTRGFTGLTGGNQLLAVAQVVWTLTEMPRVRSVRFTVEDQPVEVPTDDGLTAQPVDRDDYRSVAPAAEPTPSPSPPTD